MRRREIVPIIGYFEGLDDPREEGRTRHKLVDILTIALLAVICGANTWTEVAAYGRSKEAWLRTFLELPHGIPSHDTFGRVFSLIDPRQLEACYRQWVVRLPKRSQERLVAILTQAPQWFQPRRHRRQGSGRLTPSVPGSKREPHELRCRRTSH